MAIEKKKYWIVNQAGSKAEILLYGYIGSDDIKAIDFAQELKSLEKTHANIDIRINSVGGSVFEGFAIYNAMKQSKAVIDTYIDGVAASMGGVIALGGRKVFMSKVARVMIHPPSGMVMGSANEMRQNAELLDGLEKSLAGIYAAKTGLTVDQVNEKYLNGKDNWFSAVEALNEKLIDEIYDAEPVELPKTLNNEKAVWEAFNNKLENSFTNNNNMKQINLSAAIIAALQLNDTADALAFEAAINNLVAERNAAREAQQQAEKRLAEIEKANNADKITMLLDQAMNVDKKITKELYGVLAQQYEGNPDALKTVLDVMPKFVSISNAIEGGAAADEFSGNWEQLDKADKLRALKEKNFELFKSKYKEAFGKEFKAA